MLKRLFQNISLRLRIIIVGGLLFIFMVIYNVFTLNNLHKIRVGVKQTETYILEYNDDISRIENLLNNTLLRFYVFTRQKISYVDFYNYYQSNVSEISTLINDLERRVESYEEYVLVNKLKSSFKLFNDISLEIIRSYKLNDIETLNKLLVNVNDVYKTTRTNLGNVKTYVIGKQHNRYLLLQSSVKKIQRALIFVDILLVLGGLAFIVLMYLTFVEGFYKISRTVEALSEGRIPSELPQEDKSELGMIIRRLNMIIRSRKLLHEILENLRSENYEAIDYELVKEVDVVYTSLINLAVQLREAKQQQLARIKEEENRRWITEGLNLFSEVMRNTSNDLQLLGDAVIKNLVKYLNASVGGLYILDDTHPEDVHLKLLSVFAYDRKKFYTRRIDLGEGLIGSVAVDQTILNLTDIPDDYIEIESGLGDSKPNNLLIVPLKTDRGLHGVFEIASFHKFEQHELDFAEQVASSIAATLEAVKVNARTVQLLEETRQKSEELAKREQELRRLYDQMQKARQEAEARAAEMSSILNAVSQVLLRVEVDPQGIVTTANESFLRTLKISRNQAIGENFRTILPKDQENLDQVILKKLHALQVYKDTFHYQVGDQDVWLLVTFAPILGPNDELIRILWLSIDITEQKEIELRNAKLLEESIKKSEELMKAHQIVKRNEVELKSILEGIDQTLLRAEYSVEGILLFANEKHRRTLGYNYEEVLGKSIFIFIPEEEKEEFAKLWKEVAGGALKQIQVKRKTATGQDIWLLNQYTPIRDEQGNITKVLYLAIDVTEQVEAEQKARRALEESQKIQKELAEKEAELRSILEGIDRAILRADYTPEGILTFANELHRQTFGYNYEDVLGKSIFIFIPEEEKEDFAKLWEEVASGQMKQVRVRRYTVTGEEVWLLNQYTPVVDPNTGKVTKILYLAQNITEQVHAELEAKRALEESQKIQKELIEKEAELRSVLEGIDRAILRAEYTPHGILTYANELHRKTFGYNYEEVLGQSIFIFIPEEEKEDFERLWREVVENHEMKQVRVKRYKVTGEEVWLLNQYTPVIDPDSGQVTKVLYLAQDITEQVRAELEAKEALERAKKQERQLVSYQQVLQKAEAERRAILEGIDRVILRAEYSIEGTLLFANELHRKTLGYNYEDALGKPIFQFIPEEEREEFQKLWDEVKSGKSKQLRVRRLKPDGEEVWLLNQYTPVVDSTTGEVIKILYLAQDITEQVRAELEAKKALESAKRHEQQLLSFQKVLQKAEAERRAILEGIDRVILRAEYSPDGSLLFANELHRKTLGYDYDEALGKSIFQFVPEDEQEEIRKVWDEVLQGKTKQVRVRRFTAEGKEIWLLNQYTPVVDEKGQVYKVLYLAQDITDQVRAEQEAKKALKEALVRETEAIRLQKESLEYQQRIENLIKAIDSIIYRVSFDLEGNFVEVSENMKELLSREDFEGISYRDVLSEESLQVFERAFNKAKDGEYLKVRVKFDINSGKEIWFLSAFAPIYEAEKITNVVVFNIDITDQIQKERKIETLLREVMERELEQEAILFAIDSTMLRALYSVEGNLLNANKKHVETLGYDLDQVRGKSIFEFIPDDEKHDFEKLWKDVVSGKPRQVLVRRFRKDTGEALWLLNQYTPVFDEHGNVQKILYIALDFTEYKKLEQEILERERELLYLRQGIDSTLLRAEYTADGILLDANELHQNTLGYDIKQMRGKSILEFVPEQERENFMQFWERIKKGESFEVAVHRQRKDTGEDLWLLNHYIPVKDPKGNVVRIIYLATDITKQREVEAKFVSLFQGIDNLVLRAEYLPDGTFVDSNQMHQQILGYDIDQMKGKSIFEFVQPEEREDFEKLWKKIVSGQPQSVTVLRYRKDTGEPIWLLNNYVPIKDAHGNVISVLYIALDITREKEAEKEFEQVVRGIDKWFLRADYTSDGILISSNRNHQKVLGYDIEEYAGKSIMEFIPEEEKADFQKLWDEVSSGKFVQKLVRRRREDNGQEIWLLNHYIPLQDEQGNVVRVIYLAIDITEEKYIEEKFEYLLQGVDRTLLRAEYDTDGRLIASNKLHQQILGYNLADYVGKSILEFVPEEEREKFEANIWGRVLKGETYQVVVRRERQDTGQEIWLLNQYIPVTDARGNVVRVIYLAIDITEQKQLEKRLHYLTLGVDQTLLRAEYTPDGTLLDANQLHQDVIGYDLNKMRGKNILEFVPEEEREEFKKIWEKVTSGERMQIVVRRIRKDTGEQIWLLNQYIPIVDSQGKVESVIYLAIDITAYRKTYEETAELRGEIDALSYAVDETMLRAEYSPDGILLNANQRHTKVLGYDLEEMRGKSILEFIPEQEKEEFKKVWEKVKAGEPHQMVVKRKNMETGQDVWLVNQYTPVFDKEGNVVKIIYLAIDITDRKFSDKLSGSGSDFDSDIDKQINDWLDDIS